MKKVLLTIFMLIFMLGCGAEKESGYVTEIKVIQGKKTELSKESFVQKEQPKIEEKVQETVQEKTVENVEENSVAEEQNTEENNKMGEGSQTQVVETKSPAIKFDDEEISVPVRDTKQVGVNEATNQTQIATEKDITVKETTVVAEERNLIDEAGVKEETAPEEKLVANLESDGKYSFTRGFNLKVTDQPINGNKKDFLRKNTRVSVLEVRTVGEKNPIEMARVQYKKDKKVSEGWVLKKELTGKMADSLPQNWAQLDFIANPKKSYASNPKRIVKGIYVSATSISSSKSVDRLIELTKKSEINAFVIDVKDDDGLLLWSMPEITAKYGINSDRVTRVKDINALIAKLKANNIYLIARVVSFKDPTYAKAKPARTIMDKRTGKPFTNADGLIWVSAHDRELWQYNIDVSKAAAKVGFNEIQFDYVRFPASNGGKLDPYLDYRNPKNESKPVAIQRYLKEAYKQLSPMEVYVAADVYGQVASSPDDMALGQYWEAVSNYVDYICPMVYPSHYAPGVYGTKIPDAEPYRVVQGSTRDALNRNYNIDTPAEVRTWIQDFTAPWVKGHIKYGIKEVREQIKALNDLGYKEYILWNAGNRYTFEKQN